MAKKKATKKTVKKTSTKKSVKKSTKKSSKKTAKKKTSRSSRAEKKSNKKVAKKNPKKNTTKVVKKVSKTTSEKKKKSKNQVTKIARKKSTPRAKKKIVDVSKQKASTKVKSEEIPGSFVPVTVIKHLVKRKGHIEIYDDYKVYASVYAAALNCHYTELDAEIIANKVRQQINKWIEPLESVTAHEIKEHIITCIQDQDVALMYKHHLDVC